MVSSARPTSEPPRSRTITAVLPSGATAGKPAKRTKSLEGPVHESQRRPALSSQFLHAGRASSAVRRRLAMGWYRWTKLRSFSRSGSGSCRCGEGRRSETAHPRGRSPCRTGEGARHRRRLRTGHRRPPRPLPPGTRGCNVTAGVACRGARGWWDRGNTARPTMTGPPAAVTWAADGLGGRHECVTWTLPEPILATPCLILLCSPVGPASRSYGQGLLLSVVQCQRPAARSRTSKSPASQMIYILDTAPPPTRAANLAHGAPPAATPWKKTQC